MKQTTEFNKKNEIVAPPYSLEAEQSVLGGLMRNNQVWEDISTKLSKEDFYTPAHRHIFDAISHLAINEQPFDPLTISSWLQQKHLLESVGGGEFVVKLMTNTPSVANIISYAEIVHERSILRQLIHTGQQLANLAYHPEGRSSYVLIEEAEQLITAISEKRNRTNNLMPIRPIIEKAVAKIDQLSNNTNSITGLATGFKDLDKMTSGLQSSDLIIVAARPSMGKTTFAMNIVEQITLSQDGPVLVFSLEMPSEQLVMRMLSSIGLIDQSRIRNGQLEEDDWPKLAGAIEHLKDKKLYIDDSPNLSPQEIRNRIRQVVKETKVNPALIMIDYLQLMQIPGYKEGRTNEISSISRSLKAIAKEFNAPVVALSQLNRSLEQRPNKRPINSDLRESGAIEQDADVILFIYRDEVYHPDTELKGIAEIIIGKQRNGPIGQIKLLFMNKYTRFENLAAEHFSNQ